MLIVFLGFLSAIPAKAGGTYHMTVGQTMWLNFSTSKDINSTSWISYGSPNIVNVKTQGWTSAQIEAVGSFSSSVIVRCDYYYWITSGTYRYLANGAEDFQIYVDPVIPTNISIPSSLTVNIGDYSTLSPSLTPSNGETTLTWSSDNVSVAAVSSSGVVHAMSSGTANVTVRTSNGLSSTCQVSVPRATQTITFPAIANQFTTSPTLALTGAAAATSSSGLAVTYSVVSGPATLSGSTLTLTGAGTVIVRADQAGNATYAPANSVDRSFIISGVVAQTITFPAIANQLMSSPTVALTGATAATSSSGLAITYSVVSGPATLSGTTLTLTGAGTVTVRAIQNGNATYAPAISVDQSFTVSRVAQTITFPVIVNQLMSNPTVALTGAAAATSSSGLPITYSVVSGFATLNGTTLTLTGAGTVIIRAAQAGNATYAAAISVDQSFTVSRAGPQISAGGSHSLFLKSDGSVWASGKNNYGQLGDGTTTNRSTPVPVMNGVAAISAGSNHTLFLKSDGSVWATGANGNGQLGDGTKTARITPVQVMGGVAAISAGKYHSLFLKSDGSVWATGANLSGELGDGTSTDRMTPLQVMSGGAAISAGASHSLFLKSDGSVWATGANAYGQLGDGTTTNRHTPVQVMGGVAAISAGNGYTLLLKSDGSVWVTGYNGGRSVFR